MCVRERPDVNVCVCVCVWKCALSFQTQKEGRGVCARDTPGKRRATCSGPVERESARAREREREREREGGDSRSAYCTTLLIGIHHSPKLLTLLLSRQQTVEALCQCACVCVCAYVCTCVVK